MSVLIGDLERKKQAAKQRVLWKWSVFVYAQTLCFEAVITMTYWILLFPHMPPTSTWEWTRRGMDHSFPIIMLSGDFALNAILFSPRHFVFQVTMLFSYLIVNMSITFGTGKPIYNILNWKDAFSYIATPLGTTLAGF